jgi:hypothetical protein
MTAGTIILYARQLGINHNVVDFLHRFHTDEIFQSRADFITRCDELELLIREKRDMPHEILRSPQD